MGKKGCKHTHFLASFFPMLVNNGKILNMKIIAKQKIHKISSFLLKNDEGHGPIYKPATSIFV